MIALLCPFLILILLIGSAFALLKRRYIIGIVLIAASLLLNYYAKVFALNFSGSSCSDDLEVLTFNINGSEIADDRDIENLFNLLVRLNADVLFLAEDFEPVGEKLNKLLMNHYPYTTYKQKTDWKGHYFYSKYPLGMMDHIDIESNRFSYCFHCNVAYGQDSVSLFGCHLASNNYQLQKPSVRPENINGIPSLGKYLNNIESATEQRCEEVSGITGHLAFNGCTIVMGDFNDVSGSKPLRMLECAGLKDAWWKNGFGYGATIHHPLPFRIDHIMYGRGMKLKSIKKIDSEGLSDHDALMASFELSNTK